MSRVSVSNCSICTEVLEHIQEPEKFIAEIYRILKVGGAGIVTVSWQARYHYIPHDYYRFMPLAITILFQNSSLIKVAHRGTDITTIVSKIIVVYFRNLKLQKQLISWLLKNSIGHNFFPFLILCILVSHLSLVFGFGSEDDLLGYTIWLQK